MNLILFSKEEVGQPLPRSDLRAEHLLSVLRRREGDSFDVGLIDGPRGKCILREIGPSSLMLEFSWSEEPEPLAPIELIIGLPRPQTARKILLESSSLGVSAMHFITSEKGEPSYAQSTLWSSGEWRRILIAGAEQAFCTRLPKVDFGRDLAEVLEGLPPGSTRLALDNYEASVRLGEKADFTAPVILALGSERGWSESERTLVRTHGFQLAHLGTRVLRTETAVTAAVSLTLARLGRM